MLFCTLASPLFNPLCLSLARLVCPRREKRARRDLARSTISASSNALRHHPLTNSIDLLVKEPSKQAPSLPQDSRDFFATAIINCACNSVAPPFVHVKSFKWHKLSSSKAQYHDAFFHINQNSIFISFMRKSAKINNNEHLSLLLYKVLYFPLFLCLSYICIKIVLNIF